MPYSSREKKNEYMRKWRKTWNEEKKARVAQQTKEWRQRNPELVKAWKKRYSKKHAEKIRAKSNWYYHNIRKKLVKANPEKYREQEKQWNQNRIIRWRNFLNEQREILGGKCTKCNFNQEIRILQFHHTNPEEKIMDVTLIRNKKKALEEIKKCILLCPNCHAIKHLNNH